MRWAKPLRSRKRAQRPFTTFDVASGEIITRGLSMPHSPRWHDGQLWLVESGHGSIGIVDLSTGRYEPIAELPDFAHGLTFLGPYALVGLSQVRESATFSGIPLVDRLAERTCGVWMIDTRTGATAGFVKFDAGVDKIFAVEVLPGMNYPDLVNDDADVIGTTFTLPELVLNKVPST